jgi:hypothetical protein
MIIHNEKHNPIHSLTKNAPSMPFDTTFQFTTLGCTALRSSRKKIPLDRFFS